MRGGRLRRGLKHMPGLASIYRAFGARWRRPRSARQSALQEHQCAPHKSRGGQPRTWLTCGQVVRGYVFPQFGGTSWYRFLRERCRPTPRRLALSLCSGDGAVERQLLKWGVCRACEGVDISPALVAWARGRARAEGVANVTYRVADVETMELTGNCYDLVVGWMGLHHLSHLRGMFARVRGALRRDGLFVVNEYVGPARFQMPSAQVELICEWLARLPPSLRVTASGEVRNGFRPPRPEEVAAEDPTEAISSDRILPELERQFEIVERVDYGGNLLQWVLLDITQNFQADNPEHQAWLERLFEAEREFLRQGAVSSDFTFVIARPKGNRGG